MPLFKKKPKPEERIKMWKREIKKQERIIDRAISELEMEEKKTQIQVKTYAKKGEEQTAKLVAKQLVKSRAAKHRLIKSKTQLASVHMTLTQQQATIRSAGCLQKSAQVMTYMNKLANVGQISRTMMVMQREMEKAGLIDEMVEDTMENDDIEDMDEEADAEVEKIYDELTLGVMGSPAVRGKLPSTPDKEDDDLAERMRALQGT